MMRRLSAALHTTAKRGAVATTSVRFQNSWRPAHVPTNDDPMNYLDYGHPEDPLHYQLLALRPGTRLYEVKLRFLLQCRRHHPAVGGDPERFLRINLAYQDVLKDYGLETINGEIVNLGNFQVDPSTARDYLQLRASINEHIPYSTLLDHIKEIEVVEQKLIDVKRELIANGKIDDGHLLDGEYAKLEENSMFPPTAQLAASSGATPEGDAAANATASQAVEGAETATQTPEAAAVKTEFDDVQAASTSATQQPAADATPKDDGHNSLQNVEEHHELSEQERMSAELRNLDIGDIVDRKTGKLDEDLLAMQVLSREELEVYERKYDVEYRSDIAGESARCATVIMNNVGEVKQIKHWFLAAFAVWGTFAAIVFGGYEALARRKGVAKAQAGNVGNKDVDGDMALPWWGNDTEYERQVKRLYVEEWMKARRTARRVQTYQDGVQREVKTDAERAQEDVEIFHVSPERLAKMREHALAQNGKY